MTTRILALLAILLVCLYGEGGAIPWRGYSCQPATGRADGAQAVCASMWVWA